MSGPVKNALCDICGYQHKSERYLCWKCGAPLTAIDEGLGIEPCTVWVSVPNKMLPELYYHQDEVIKLRDQLAEMTRRRDEWRAKAGGYDDLRAAVRKGIADAGDRDLSRIFLRGAMVEMQAQVAELTHALQVINAMPPFKPLIEAQRVSDAALAKIAQHDS